VSEEKRPGTGFRSVAEHTFLRITQLPGWSPPGAWVIRYEECGRSFYFPRRYIEGIPLAQQWKEDKMAAAWFWDKAGAEYALEEIKDCVREGSLRAEPLGYGA
jgi:hypothetical protein